MKLLRLLLSSSRLTCLVLAAASSLTAQTVSDSSAQPKAPSLGATSLKSPALAKKIVLIGGKKSHAEGEHDFPNGIPLIAAWLRASPLFANADILTYTAGWPADLTVLEGADAVVCYFDGVQEKPEPLNNTERIAAIQKLMDHGAGLVCLHQSSTVPTDNSSIPLNQWLGARRNGMWDRTTEKVTLSPASPEHPISSGVGTFTYTDEFYPTLIFSDEKAITPILKAEVTPKFGDKKKQEINPPAKAEHVLAWAYNRPDGGRAFGFTGGHYLKALHEPQLQKLLVNAIAWTSKVEVPKNGVSTPEPIVPTSVVVKKQDAKIVPMPWGHLRWFTSAELKNSRTMTTGIAVIEPGKSNPKHFHPNCDEILHVIAGKIEHTMNEVTVELNEGDTVSIPQGVFHNAKNIGSEDAVLGISFSSAYREAVGY
ncbi:MAG: ThuA domain-containing protein [Verrucomicrobiota bacterium]